MSAGMIATWALCALSAGVLWQALGATLTGLALPAAGFATGLEGQIGALLAQAGEAATLGGETLCGIGAAAWVIVMLARLRRAAV